MDETPIKQWSEIRVDGGSALHTDCWIEWDRPCWELIFSGVVGGEPYRIRTAIPATRAPTWHVALPVGSLVFLEVRDRRGLVFWRGEILTTECTSSGATLNQMTDQPDPKAPAPAASGEIRVQAESAPDVAPKAWVWAHRQWMDWARDLLRASRPGQDVEIEDMLASELRSALAKLYALKREARTVDTAEVE